MTNQSPVSGTNSKAPALRAPNPFLTFHQEMNRLFADMLGAFNGGAAPPSALSAAFAPDIDVSETDDEVHVSIDLPGMKDSDIEVAMEGDVLIITGERRDERDEDRENFHFTERSFGAFQRALRLPDHVLPDQVRAEFEDGVLRITAPKIRSGEERKKIEIKPGNGKTEQTH